MTKRPCVLCILDGWGIAEDSKYNAISVAKTPNYDRFLKKYPNSKLVASGARVGLPDGQIGNSEVGHTNIGAGRVVLQDFPRINKAVNDGVLGENAVLVSLIEKLKKNGGVCHLLGLLSDGGVHSHENHIIELAKVVASKGIVVRLHAFMDGRDVAPKSCLGFIERFEREVAGVGDIKIATVGGRFYGMDRDKRWERVEKAYTCMVNGQGGWFIRAVDGVNDAYANKLTDEFIEPFSVGKYNGMNDGDSLLIANFRADRVREIAEALANPKFEGFEREKVVKFVECVGMKEYSEKLNNWYKVMFAPEEINNSLGEVVSKAGLKQLRLAETEKYAHVTFFFSGGREKEYVGEDRVLVDSPKVATYDLKPEMSATEVRHKLVEAINSDKYDLIVVNFANPDMVGHTGVMDAAVEACEVIDKIIGEAEEAIKERDGIMLVTADHGNLEKMFDDKKGQPYTAHTTNLVPFIMVGNDVGGVSLADGALCDIAPSVLSLMGLEKPKEMSGESLIRKK
jgi:2,3-bisphosphoglycerate-independent phosphoglycerate mutase